MKRIVVKGKAGEDFIKGVTARKKEFEKKLEERLPPAEVRKQIEEEVVKTSELNKDNGTFDVQSYRLGMYSMWFLLKRKGYAKEQKLLC